MRNCEGACQRRSLGLFCWLTLVPLGASMALAQSLPPSSRTVFKCEVAGKVVYSDTPCLGASKVDVEPTRGKDAKQMEVAGKRMKLSADAQGQCRNLDGQIPVAEKQEAQATGPDRQVLQVRLFTLRQQFRDLRC